MPQRDPSFYQCVKAQNLDPQIIRRLVTTRRSHRLVLPSIGSRIFCIRMDLNLFRVCFPLKSLGYYIIIVIFGIIGDSYDAVVVLTLVLHLLDGGAMTLLSVVLLALIHVLLVFLSWSYFMILLRDLGSVHANWKMLPQQNVEDENFVISSIQVVITNSSTMTTSQGLERKPIGYCDRCQIGKLPRCHHCSVSCSPSVPIHVGTHMLWNLNIFKEAFSSVLNGGKGLQCLYGIAPSSLFHSLTKKLKESSRRNTGYLLHGKSSL